jgi:hypothetical protein
MDGDEFLWQFIEIDGWFPSMPQSLVQNAIFPVSELIRNMCS